MLHLSALVPTKVIKVRQVGVVLIFHDRLMATGKKPTGSVLKGDKRASVHYGYQIVRPRIR